MFTLLFFVEYSTPFRLLHWSCPRRPKQMMRYLCWLWHDTPETDAHAGLDNMPSRQHLSLIWKIRKRLYLKILVISKIPVFSSVDANSLLNWSGHLFFIMFPGTEMKIYGTFFKAQSFRTHLGIKEKLSLTYFFYT